MEEYEFTVEGQIGPDSFRVRELLALFEKLEQAIAIESGIRVSEAENKSTIRIVSIAPGSFRSRYRAVDQFRAGARRIMEAHGRLDAPGLKPRSVRLLRTFHQRFAERGATAFRMSVSGEAGNLQEVVWPSLRVFPEPGPDQFYHGETDLLVYVIRIGGIKQPTAKVRVLDGDYEMTVELADRDLALQLKDSLYGTAILHGQARWDRDWDLDRFEVQSVMSAPSWAEEAFAQLLKHFNGGINLGPDSDLMRRLKGETE